MVNLLARMSAALQSFRYPNDGYGNGTSGYQRGYTVNGDNFIANLSILRDDLTQAILATDPQQNSAVMACLGWLMDVWPEAPLKVYREGDDGLAPEKMPSANPGIKEFQRILRRPNEDYGDTVLWMGTLLSLKLDGNAYWQKLRNDVGAVVGYMYLPHHLVEPWWPQAGNVYIERYNYSPGGTMVPIPREDVIHFRDGMDPKNTRKGLSRLKSAMREVFTDDEGSNYTAAILWRKGVISGILSPDPAMFSNGREVDLDKPKAEALKEKMDRETRGQNRGGIVVNSIALKYQRVGTDPSEMNARELRMTPEERICAIFRIPPGVVKLGAGLERNTMSNAETEEKQAYRGAVLPVHRMIKDTLEQQALPDFTDDLSYVLGFDTTGVNALQEDRLESAKIEEILVHTRMTVNQLRAKYGDPPIKGGDTILWPKGQIEPEVVQAATPAPTPQPAKKGGK